MALINFAGEGDNNLILILVAIVATLFFLRMAMTRRMFKRSGPSPDLSLRQEENVRADLGKILVDIQEISREHIGTMDSKIRMLNALIVESDQKIQEIKTLIARMEELTHEARSPAPAAAVPPGNPLHARIFEYADRGLSVEAICRETGMEKGEVELILGLRQI